MKVSKQEILDIIKKNGLSKEQAETILEMLGKGLGGSLIDIIGLVAKKTPNKIDDIVFGSSEGQMRKYIEEIEITL